MAVNPSPHDQRIQNMINALQNLQALNATDPLTTNLIAVLVPMIREFVAIRAALVSLPLPSNFKNLDQ